jgi:hypothetical protein
MSIKYLLGICECKGCKRRGVCKAEVTGTSKKGKPLKIKHWLCEQHVIEIVRKGKICSATYEETVHFDAEVE